MSSKPLSNRRSLRSDNSRSISVGEMTPSKALRRRPQATGRRLTLVKAPFALHEVKDSIRVLAVTPEAVELLVPRKDFEPDAAFQEQRHRCLEALVRGIEKHSRKYYLTCVVMNLGEDRRLDSWNQVKKVILEAGGRLENLAGQKVSDYLRQLKLQMG